MLAAENGLPGGRARDEGARAHAHTLTQRRSSAPYSARARFRHFGDHAISRTRLSPPLFFYGCKGQTCNVRSQGGEPGDEATDSPRSYLVDTPSGTLRRNSRHLITKPTKVPTRIQPKTLLTKNVKILSNIHLWTLREGLLLVHRLELALTHQTDGTKRGDVVLLTETCIYVCLYLMQCYDVHSMF